MLVLSGTGEVIEPDQPFVAIGSGGNYAYAAANALYNNTDLGAEDIVRKSWRSHPPSVCIRMITFRLKNYRRCRMANKLYQMTPKEIVQELDKYIIGQDEAKKSVAIALRNRYRRSLLSEKMREEITPKNILMIEANVPDVVRLRSLVVLAKLMDAPFVKVEATKFTEVGYVGRDVDSMVRDLVEASIRITKQAMLEEKYSIADEIVEEKIIEAIIPAEESCQQQESQAIFSFYPGNSGYLSQKEEYEQQQQQKEQTETPGMDTDLAREQVRQQLREGLLEERVYRDPGDGCSESQQSGSGQ